MVLEVAIARYGVPEHLRSDNGPSLSPMPSWNGWPSKRSLGVQERRPRRRHSDGHHFGSLLVLAVTAGAFMLVTWIATKALFVFLESIKKWVLESHFGLGVRVKMTRFSDGRQAFLHSLRTTTPRFFMLSYFRAGGRGEAAVRSTPTTAVILECSFIRMFPTSTRRFTLR